MEVLSICLVALATVLLARFIAFCCRGSSKARKLPPGPWTLPIIGSLHHVLSALPHRAMAELSRRHGPLMFLRLGEVPTIVASSAEAAALVMKTNDLACASRPRSATMDIISGGGKGIGAAPYSEYWRQMRKVCVGELLSAKQYKRMEGIRAQEVANLLRSITTTSGAVNLSRKLVALTNNIGSRALFSDGCARQDEFLRELDLILRHIGGFCLADLFPSSWLVRWFSSAERNTRKSYGRIQRIIMCIMDERKLGRSADNRASPDNEDMLEVLLRLQEQDSLAFPLTAQDISAVIYDIFAAATETTATVLEWAMSELFNHPKVMDKVQSEVREVLGRDKTVIVNTDLTELHYMRMVIKEVLRTHPPVPLLVPRETREDCEIMGYHIPKGTNVHVNVFAICRDPTSWESPEEFKPERFDNNNIDYYGRHFELTPFGSGRRQCPGIRLGMSTVEIGLANLLYHFDWVHPNGEDAERLDMSEKFGITAGRMFDLQLKAIPHVPSTSI